MRIRRRTRRVLGTPVVVGPAAEQRVRLIGLLGTVSRAIALQPAAEEVMAACALPGDTPAAVARRGSRIAGEYYRLYGWAADLSRDAAPDSPQARAAELIHYHGTMIDLCLKLTFPKTPTPILDRRRSACDGFGEPARTLREMRTLLLMWLRELDDESAE
ncbi:MAG TPA: hypothetical protein VHF06_08650 [Pseudonocardiaceae bacterium]|jgi:hypothetical protein|nr:hypothetical protein [Pseudonocardiaceae bacterium]